MRRHVRRHSEGPSAGLAGLGLELAAAVAGFSLMGYWIDHKFETEPWGIIICASIGIVGGLLNFVRAANEAVRRSGGLDRGDE